MLGIADRPRSSGRRLRGALGTGLVLAVFGGALGGAAVPVAVAAATTTHATTTQAATDPNAPVPVPDLTVPPPGRRLSAHQVLAIVSALPKVRRERARNPGSYGGAYLKGPGRWQVSYFSKRGAKEIVQVYVADATGRVTEQWTGFQVAWSMARGYAGAFARRVNALYVWIPLCLLFFVPLINPRRLRSLLHLDLLVLLSFSVSLAFFNHADIGMSTPLVYPPLLYLLGRMLWLARRRRGPAVAPGPLRTLAPPSWLAVGVVFLLGFRIALNVVDSNVVDVGYAGVIGAHRILHGQSLYGHWPADNQHGDTYGPVSYESYVPFVAALGWSGRWDQLPAAHAASILFDLLAIGLLFLLGRRVRGPTLGITLAYAWSAYPFTLFALDSNTNDALVAALVLAALLAAAHPVRRGAVAALAGLSKFAPLALAPLLATEGLHDAGRRRRVRGLVLFALGFVATGAITGLPAVTHNSLRTLWEQTFVYQANRHSPFSIWGLWGGLSVEQMLVELAAVALAVALAVRPRRTDVVGLAAACAAVLIAVQLGVDHWFYLYIPWFLGAALVALLGRFSDPQAPPAGASEPARSHRLVAA